MNEIPVKEVHVATRRIRRGKITNDELAIGFQKAKKSCEDSLENCIVKIVKQSSWPDEIIGLFRRKSEHIFLEESDVINKFFA